VSSSVIAFRPDEFGTVEGGVPLPESMKDVPLVDKRLIPPPTFETITPPSSVIPFAPRRIYLASSWRNPHQPHAVELLRELGNEVYDFRNPRPGDNGFAWSEIDPDWIGWHPAQFRDLLRHPIAQAGFQSDFDAMEWADTFVLLLPCGRSAHLEAGWAIGAGKPTCIVLHEDKFEPELMYLMAAEIVTDIEDAAVWVECLRAEAVPDAA
jgi:nucleoside 2-deoxyribosyltransferase